jgi:hypothetical protein
MKIMKMKKLTCAKTGNWSYCTNERYEKLIKKFGSEEALKMGWMSRIGKRMTAEGSVSVPSDSSVNAILPSR